MNLTTHAAKCRTDVIHGLPDDNFSGLGVLDYEAWRPNWDRCVRKYYLDFIRMHCDCAYVVGIGHSIRVHRDCVVIDRDWDSMNVYRSESIALVQQKHPTWSKSQVEAEAKIEFEAAAKYKCMTSPCNPC